MRRGSGEADVAPDQFLAQELVGTGADRLDETEFLCAVEKALRPKPGYHQTSTILQGVRVADRKTVDAGLEGRELLMHAEIGGVGRSGS
jgi:hypothetical protein